MIADNELERIWKEAITAELKLLSRHFPGANEENHETFPSEESVFWSRFRVGTSQMRVTA
jgi:hypothetical protein